MTSCSSWQYLGKILAKSFPRSWQDLAKILLRYPWRVGLTLSIVDVKTQIVQRTNFDKAQR